jgi:lysozyme family protein
VTAERLASNARRIARKPTPIGINEGAGMAAVTFHEALRRLLLHEGGYSNHPSDPGGPTNFGITIHDYRKYVKPGATAADVRAMTRVQAEVIYRAKYWDAQRCDELPAGVDYAVFDYGVNSGIGRSGKVLRRVLGLADTSSVVTDAVLAAAAKRDPGRLIEGICDERLRFLKSLKTWSVFGKGWERRVREVRAAAQGHAGEAPPPAATPANTRAHGVGAGRLRGPGRRSKRDLPVQPQRKPAGHRRPVLARRPPSGDHASPGALLPTPAVAMGAARLDLRDKPVATTVPERAPGARVRGRTRTPSSCRVTGQEQLDHYLPGSRFILTRLPGPYRLTPVRSGQLAICPRG